MAGQGAKKRIEENKRRLRLLIIWLAVGLAAQVLNLAVRGFQTWRFIGLLATVSVNAFTYQSISALAAPVYDPSSGELLDGGADLDMKGFCGYYHDVLYITVIVQVSARLEAGAQHKQQGGPLTTQLAPAQAAAAPCAGLAGTSFDL